MMESVIKWLIKRLVFVWDKNNDKLAFDFARNDNVDYSIIVTRYFDGYCMIGTQKISYKHEAKDEA